MSAITLDDSQLAAVHISSEDRQIVIAGPGAGKSQVVGALAEHLIQDGRLYPDEILLISFSRAAVKVARERTEHLVEEGVGIAVSTIDSLAATILLESDDVGFNGYDDAIQRATKAMKEGTVAALENVRHVIVDEVQDVVGVRATFLLTLLDYLVPHDVGFSLLGDPLQSIYDFQLSGPAALDSQRLLTEVARRFEPTARELTGEYRARTTDAREATDDRPALIGRDPRSRLMHLRTHATRLIPLGTLDADAVEDLSGWSGTTALLCDTNIRAALAAERAAEHGLRVELAARATEPFLPGWIARVLQRHPRTSISRDEFAGLLAANGLEGGDDRWRLLLSVSGSRRDLELARLADGMRLSRHTRELADPVGTGVTASTVHRAKGLEFDNVVLVDPLEWGGVEEDPDALARQLFVALTRARDRLVSVYGVETRGWSLQRFGARTFWGKRALWGARRTTHLLLEPEHARGSGPVETDLEAVVGRAVDWHRGDPIRSVDGEDLPRWIATVDGRPVASTGEGFADVVRRTLFDRSGGRWPDLVGGRVVGTETVVGPHGAVTDTAAHGFWVGARVSGPVELKWSER